MKEYGDKIDGGKKSAIEDALNKLKQAHKSEDLSGIDSAEEQLNAAWMAASEEMYKAGAQGGQGEPQHADAGNKDGGVSDAEYEEVK